jgi:protein SCO1
MTLKHIMRKQTLFLMILTGTIAMAGGLWLGQADNQPIFKPAVIQGAIYPKAKVLNDFLLQDQLSHNFTNESLQNHWSLIFVGYTHCPDVCPTTMKVMNTVNEFMLEQKIQPPQIIFLTIDPERDTSEVIKPYVNYFNENFTGLTGSLDEVTQFSQQLNAVFRKAPGAGGKITADDYLMDHSSALMLINPDGNLQSILTAPHTPGRIIEGIINSQAYFEKVKSLN